MAENQNKIVLFSVAEEEAGNKEKIDAFRKAIKGKRELLIELTPENIQQVVGKREFSHMPLVAAYQRLALIAHQAGLKVIALDEQKKLDAISDAEISASVLSGRPEMDIRHDELLYYLCYTDRERSWLRKLKARNAKAIAAMAPGHSEEISKKLRIPKGNIIGEVKDRGNYRAFAAKEAARRKEETAVWKRLEAEQDLRKFGSFAKRRQERKRRRI